MTLNAWQKRRALSGWSGGYVEWIDKGTAYLSVVFSWQLQRAYQRAVALRSREYEVRVGGPAVALNPDFLAEVAEVGGSVDALTKHNPQATFTTRGCIRHCPFCAVPITEGRFRELDDWMPRPIVCDNNFLASSRQHFDGVIDRLKLAGVQDVDFNQGLDARLLTAYHAQRLAELPFKCLRLAWDDVRLEGAFMRAFQTLRGAGVPADKIHVYVLFGYDDTPEDALYRMQTIWGELKAWPNPMRFQPLDAVKRNSYVAPGWTEYELRKMSKYWSNLRHLSGIPYDEYDPWLRRRQQAQTREQMPMWGAGREQA